MTIPPTQDADVAALVEWLKDGVDTCREMAARNKSKGDGGGAESDYASMHMFLAHLSTVTRMAETIARLERELADYKQTALTTARAEMRERAADKVMDFCRTGATPSDVSAAIMALPLEPEGDGT